MDLEERGDVQGSLFVPFRGNRFYGVPPPCGAPRQVGPGPRERHSAGFSESTPDRAFFHSPRVKSGIGSGAPLALMER